MNTNIYPMFESSICMKILFRVLAMEKLSVQLQEEKNRIEKVKKSKILF